MNRVGLILVIGFLGFSSMAFANDVRTNTSVVDLVFQDEQQVIINEYQARADATYAWVQSEFDAALVAYDRGLLDAAKKGLKTEDLNRLSSRLGAVRDARIANARAEYQRRMEEHQAWYYQEMNELCVKYTGRTCLWED